MSLLAIIAWTVAGFTWAWAAWQFIRLQRLHLRNRAEAKSGRTRMSEPSYFWRITFYPDDDEHFGAQEVDFVGRLIEFARRGEAAATVR